MKTIDKIIESKEEPKDKNVLWVNGDKLLAMVKGKWTPVGGGSSDNVQGGGGESGGGGVTQDNFEYFTYDKANPNPLLLYAQYVKIESESLGMKVVAPYTLAIAELKGYYNDLDTVAFGVNLKERTITKYGETFTDVTVLDALKQNGVTEEYINAFPRLTKEEFYNLEA